VLYLGNDHCRTISAEGRLPRRDRGLKWYGCLLDIVRRFGTEKNDIFPSHIAEASIHIADEKCALKPVRQLCALLFHDAHGIDCQPALDRPQNNQQREECRQKKFNFHFEQAHDTPNSRTDSQKQTISTTITSDS